MSQFLLEHGVQLAIALGAEGPGLSDGSLRGAVRRVRIPIRGDVDSLNVAAAAAVAFAVVSRR
jgi:tRNA G18 (ribose-2'-O)-methylase SpoU